MKFTYQAYEGMLLSLKKNGYQNVSYFNWEGREKCVILRHDIDYQVDKALRVAEIEKSNGFSSTYFVLITSDFYNIFSRSNREVLQKIIEYGHEIGLHFDETSYPELKCDIYGIKNRIIEEAKLLGKMIGHEVRIVSMHRPSKKVLDADMHISGIINSYGKTYFKEFKYISDSKRRWRESIDDIVAQGIPKLHILTHAFWYNDMEMDIHQSLARFINMGNENRYNIMKNNITNLQQIMKLNDLENS